MQRLDPRPSRRLRPLYVVDHEYRPVTGPVAGMLGLMIFSAAVGVLIWWVL